MGLFVLTTENKLSLSDQGLNHVIQKSRDVQSQLKALVINMAKLTGICWLTLQSVSQKKIQYCFSNKKGICFKSSGLFQGLYNFHKLLLAETEFNVSQ